MSMQIPHNAATMEQAIRAALSPLSPTRLDIVNDSHKHAGHMGDNGSGATHFNIEIISHVFDGLSRLARQQKVMALLTPLFAQGLHAVQVSAHASHN